MITLRDYQAEAVEKIREKFRAGKAPVLFVLPTGGGKTFTFSYIASNAAQKGNRVCIIVHRKELLLQASESLHTLKIEHGIISPHFTPDPRQLVQVASVDTLVRRMERRKYHFDLLIFDEAHHVVTGNKWGRVFEELGRPSTLGVTATAVRTDGKGLGAHASGVFRSMVVGPSSPDLISRGMLVAPEVYTSLEPLDLTGLRKDKHGEYARAALAERVDRPVITGSAVEHYKRICPGAKAIVFCTNIAHAKHVRDQFRDAGYRFELLVGAPTMSDHERNAVNRKLRSGEIHGACTVDLVSEGYDLPDLECCIMLRPTESEGLFLQQVGRIMRPSEGKRGCWLLDHAGNIGAWADGEYKRKHGLPTEDREWTLDGRKKRAKKNDDGDTIAIVQCPKCAFVHEDAPHCPACGYVYSRERSGPMITDGELKKITPEMEAAMRTRKRMEQGQAQTVEDFKKLGYSPMRARKILDYRAEKKAMQESLIEDLRRWRAETGLSVLDTFGVPISAIRSMKPKALKQLREDFDQYEIDSQAQYEFF